MKISLSVLILLLAAPLAFGWWYLQGPQDRGVSFQTATLKPGRIVDQVAATGTVLPEEVIDIGARVVGQIKSFGRDPQDRSRPIDYGTLVDEGTVLAQIDDTLYQSQLLQARASLRRAEAELVQARAKLQLAERDWRRTQSLRSSHAISPADCDVAEANKVTAQAAIGVGEAAVAQAQAALEQAEINLGYTMIRSPVKGVIVDRRVNVGQTVVANLDAPSLFLIAKDLKRLQVWASVNEADVGKIRVGQPAQFRVDAYPADVFRGEVSQIRLNASINQNVVTYTVVVTTDNPDGKLLPYMTASLRFEVGRRDDVLIVPNAALRWRPRVQHVVGAARDAYAAALTRKETDSGARPARPWSEGPHDRGTLWVKAGEFVRPVPVRIGLTDGSNTEIVGGDMKEGMEVVVHEVQPIGDDAPATPFLQRQGSRKKAP
jgi:HlyD family secretion protein